VANAAVALGMRVVGYDPFLSPQARGALSPSVEVLEGEDAVVAQSDYLSVHVPMSSDTKHRYNGDFLAKCKRGIRVLNFARGELFNNAHMLAALESGQVGVYVTDFPSEDLLGKDNIVAIPHLGASTPESEDNCATMAAAQVREYILQGNIKNSVNYPNLFANKGAGERICALHKGDDGMLDKLVSAVEKTGGKVADKHTASRGGWGYSMLDFGASSDAGACIEPLSLLQGVVSVRRIK
jgi:D-3-phosphoglycerate dehydrogenase